MSPPNDKARLAVPRNDAHERILDRIEKAAEIKADDIQSERDLADAQERERRWHKYNLELLSRLFNTDKYVEEYRASRRPVHVVSDRYFDPSVSDLAGRLVGSVKSQISALHSIIERLELSDEGTIPVSSVESAVETAVQAERNLELLAERFHLAACQIQSRHAKRPTLIVKDEYDVQDLLHALLTIFFDDIRPEEWAPSHAGAPSRMDYLLPDLKIAVEAKMTRPTLKARELGEELIIDIAKYQKHAGCRKLFCLVYDPDEYISNPRGLEADLSGENGKISVRVMIVPRRH